MIIIDKVMEARLHKVEIKKRNKKVFALLLLSI